MTTIEIFQSIVARLSTVRLDAEGGAGGEPLFEVVQLSANRDLGKQLTELLVVKSRACLVVPMSIRRVVKDQSGALSVLGRKYAEVALLYTDKAYFKPTQAVTFGGAKNLGLFSFDERIEAALTGQALTPYGGIVLGDSDPLTLSDAQQKDAPGRQAWLVQALVPIGLIAESAPDSFD